jgi:hypothetical protein
VGKRHRRIRPRSATGQVAGAATEKPGLKSPSSKNRPAQHAFSQKPLSRSPDPNQGPDQEQQPPSAIFMPRRGGVWSYRAARRQAPPRGPRGFCLAGHRTRPRIELMTFCVAFARVDGSNDPELPANSRFLRVEDTVDLPRVRFRSGVKQTHQPTVGTKKACKCRSFRKRLKGFEPSTFCMTSSRWGSPSRRRFPCKQRVSAPSPRGRPLPALTARSRRFPD